MARGKIKHARADSWAAKLTEEQQWTLYDRSINGQRWEVAARWAMKEYGLERMPSRTSFFEWRAQMGENEHAHRLHLSLIAQNHARQIAANYNITAEEEVKQLVALAASAAIETKDVELGGQLLEMAMKIQAAESEKKRTEIELRKVDIREEELALLKRRVALYESQRQKAKEVVEHKKMTPEEREAKLKEIFGF